MIHTTFGSNRAAARNKLLMTHTCVGACPHAKRAPSLWFMLESSDE